MDLERRALIQLLLRRADVAEAVRLGVGTRQSRQGGAGAALVAQLDLDVALRLDRRVVHNRILTVLLVLLLALALLLLLSPLPLAALLATCCRLVARAGAGGTRLPIPVFVLALEQDDREAGGLGLVRRLRIRSLRLLHLLLETLDDFGHGVVERIQECLGIWVDALVGVEGA